MAERRNIVIAGGGMVGVSMALYLSRTLPETVDICLVEGFPFPEPAEGGVPDYHPSFDARSTALSYSTKLIYEEIGVWESLTRWLCPIETIHVSNRGRFGSTLLKAETYGWPALGYVVENAWLGNALVQILLREKRVEVISPARVTSARQEGTGTRITLEGDATLEIDADLLMVADGAASGLREQLGMMVDEKSYRQHALIANVATAEPHGGCAFERFTDRGPLALLPLVGVAAAEHRSALVWTLSLTEAETMQSCSEDEFLGHLQDRFGYRLGRLTQVGERHSYPLSLIQATEQVRQGVVIIGNAAHALHPVAGQGYNLALRDVAVLARALGAAAKQGTALGELSTLQAYQREQSSDQERTVGFSDLMPSLFMRTDPVLGLARDLALSGLDVAPALKRQFVRYAAGVADLKEVPSG